VEQTALTNYKREHALDWSQYMGTHWAHPTDTSLPRPTSSA
jgi:2-oxoglutarate dehydrogenase E1 component